MGLIIAGERSGVGKTTITLSLLASLGKQGRSVQAFKVGPDYIDPMFHASVTGRACRNLDPVLTSPDYVRSCYAKHSQSAECSIIEGVMGLFDGLPYNRQSSYPFFASTAHIARLLDLPVILVLDCSGTSGSIAAIARGCQSLDPELKIAGAILNRVASNRHQAALEAALEAIELPIMGIFHKEPGMRIPDRHLGLIPTAELPQFKRILERLARAGEKNFDWDKLNPLLGEQSTEISETLVPPESTAKPKVRLAIAKAPAFSFYYADNLEILQELGVELVPWNPLSDRSLPPSIHGLYFGGGFPEVFAQQLSENYLARAAVRQAILGGIPTYAECGGLMYLCKTVTTFEGDILDMVGIVPSDAVMGEQLTLGYRKATVLNPSPVVETESTLYGHEFHRSQLTIPHPEPDGENGVIPLFELSKCYGEAMPALEGWQMHNVHASYLHLHWGDRREIPQRFVQQMLDYSNRAVSASK